MIGVLLLAAAVQAPVFVPPADPRIQLVPFSAGAVVTLAVDPGYAAVVSLGSEERVESIVVGDSATWQVTASKRGDDVVVKPLAGATATNMVIATADRHFVFQLQPASGGGSPYVLRFVYPDATPAHAVPVAPLTPFGFRGQRTLFPAAMSDDGVRTTITWRKDVALPAVFAVEKDGREAIVNGRMVDGSFVVERIAAQFLFRLGKASAVASRRTQRRR